MKRKLLEAWVLITAEPKKAAAVGVLLAVLAVVTLRAVVLDGPRKARAGGRASGTTSSEAGATGGSSGGGGGALAGGGGAVIRQIPRSPALSRDLFGLDERVFPPPPAEAQPDDGPKSPDEVADTQTQEPPAPEVPSTRELVLEQARGLVLSSAIIGDEPIAVIETGKGKQAKRVVLRLGQEIEGFTLRRVTPTSATLEKDGIEIELHRVMPED